MTAIVHVGQSAGTGFMARLIEARPDDGPDAGGGGGSRLRTSAEEWPLADGRHRIEGQERQILKAASPWPEAPELRLFEGCVVVCGDVSAVPAGDGSITLLIVGEATVVARAMTEAEALAAASHALWPEGGDAASGQLMEVPWLTGSDDVAFQAAARRADGEPGEALIAAWLSEDGTLETHVAAHRGAYLFWNTQDGRECRECGCEEPAGPGLWLMTGGSAFSHTDWETGICDDHGIRFKSSRLVGFAEGAAAFGMTAADLEEAVTDAYPYVNGLPMADAMRARAGAEAPPDPHDAGQAVMKDGRAAT